MTTKRSTYRPGQAIEAQFGPSGWSPATYMAFRLGQHLIKNEEGDIMPAHSDQIRPVQ